MQEDLIWVSVGEAEYELHHRFDGSVPATAGLDNTLLARYPTASYASTHALTHTHNDTVFIGCYRGVGSLQSSMTLYPTDRDIGFTRQYIGIHFHKRSTQ